MFRVRWLILAAILATVMGCGRFGFASLFDNTLTVNVTTERLAGPPTMDSIDDLDPGTEGLSLMEALTIAANTPGTDMIVFDPDAFGDGVTITLTVPLPAITDSGTAISGYGASVIINGAAVFEPILDVAADDVIVRGLQFASPAGDGVSITTSSAVALTGNSFTDIGGRAIVVEDSSNVSIRSSHFERGIAEMVDVYDSTEIDVYDNFMILGDKATDRGVRLVRTTSSRISSNIIDPGDAQLVNLTDSSDIVIEKNILDRGDAGVVIEGTSTRNLVFGNIIKEMTYDGVYVGSGVTETTVVHNTIYMCSTPIVDGADDTVLGNNLIADDGFVDPASYDFRLVDGNEAIDAGEDLGYDCVADGDERYWGAAPDLGAVETR